MSRLFKLENQEIDEKLNLEIWEAFGISFAVIGSLTFFEGHYIQRQLKAGKSVNIPNLGIFTFTYPDVNLRVY